MIRFAAVIASLAIAGCASLFTDPRPVIKWHRTSTPPATVYVWDFVRADATGRIAILDRCKVDIAGKERGEPDFKDHACVYAIVDQKVPPGAYRMDDDARAEPGVPGRVCYILSTLNRPQAAWRYSGYRGDDGTMLEHEKRHCAGEDHQPFDVLMRQGGG